MKRKKKKFIGLLDLRSLQYLGRSLGPLSSGHQRHASGLRYDIMPVLTRRDCSHNVCVLEEHRDCR